MPRGLYAALETAVGPAYVTADGGDMASRLVDERGLYRGSALALVRPGSTEEVSQVVRACRAAGAAIVPQGGNTGMVGGGVPQGAVILAMDRLNRIRAVDPLNSTMTVEAGCILLDIQQTAAGINRLFPLSLAAEGSCHFNLTRPPEMTDADFLHEYPTFNRIVHDIVAGMNGSISAEHGIGLIKRGALRRYKDPASLRLMERIKAALDPGGLMNPGKVL